MELWIRSQNRQNIVKAKNIFIQSYFPTELTCIVSKQHDKEFVLGYYGSYERSLEVLDEIQNFIEGSDLFVFKNIEVGNEDVIFDNLENSRFISIPNEKPSIQEIKKQKVYQMPEE